MSLDTLCLIPALIPHRWRRFRRPTVDGFSKTAVREFHPIQNREAIMLALALMKNPPSLKQFQRHTWSGLLSINYNHPPVESEDGPVVAGVGNHILRIMHEVHPGMRLVEFFPWMRYVPSWWVHRFGPMTLLSVELQVCQVETGHTILVRPRLAEERTPSQSGRKRLSTCSL